MKNRSFDKFTISYCILMTLALAALYIENKELVAVFAILTVIINIVIFIKAFNEI